MPQHLDPDRRRVLLATLGVAGAAALQPGRAQAQELPPPPATTAALLERPENLYRLEVDFWTFASLAANVLVRSGDLTPREAARELRRPPKAVPSLVESLAENVGTEAGKVLQDRLLRSDPIDDNDRLVAAVRRVRLAVANAGLDPLEPVLATVLESPIHLQRLSEAGAEFAFVDRLSVCDIWVIRLVCNLEL